MGFLLFLCKNMIFRYNQVVGGPELTEESDKFINGQIWQGLLARVIISSNYLLFWNVHERFLYKEKVWQALPKKVSTRAGVDLDTDKIQLVWDMCRWEIQIQIKMFRWTISSKGDKWTPNVSTRDVNKIILKIRAGLGSIEELTLVRPFHSGWPGHLQLQVLKMHLSSLMISLTSLIMSLFRQDLFFYYLRGYAFDITAQQTQVLVDWLNLFFGRLRSKYMRYLWLWDFIDVRKDNTTLQPYW